MLPPEIQAQVQSLVRTDDLARLVPLLNELARQFPNEHEVHHHLGWAAMRQRRLDLAKAHLQNAIRLKPDSADSLNFLGLVLLEHEQIGEAIEVLKAAVGAQPTHVHALVNLSLSLCRVGLSDKATIFLAEALRLEPNNAHAHHYLAYALMTLERIEDAEKHVTHALALSPGTSGFLSTLGMIRERQHRIDEATQLFQQAVNADPQIAEPLSNLGSIHGGIWANYDFALQCFDRALAVKPQFWKAKYHRGLVRLVMGDYERGWSDYETRPTLLQKNSERYGRPRWRGEPINGQTILLHCEQGLGDTLQFVRYAQRTKILGAKVVCEVQKTLIPLLSNTPGIDQLIEAGAPLPSHDYQIPFMSLPTVLGVVSAPQPYLFASPDKLAFWQERIVRIPGFKVGIAWQGEPNYKYDWLRSVPLSHFAPLAQLPGVSLLSLQKHHGLEQIDANRPSVPVVALDPPIDSAGGAFMDTAAIMKHLDLVVTSDTAIAHLAGGLGVPVWLATQFAPDWRWLVARQDSPWYPTMRLFRQTRVGQWNDVFERMATELSSTTSAR